VDKLNKFLDMAKEEFHGINPLNVNTNTEDNYIKDLEKRWDDCFVC